MGTSEAQRETLGLPIPSRGYQPLYERFLRVARGQLSERAFAAAYKAGQLLPLGQAVQEALTAQAGSPAVMPAVAPAAIERLSPREREVAALIVEGHTNAEIAAALGLAPRTAETHVRNILKKLGVGSRAEIGACLGPGAGVRAIAS